MRNSRQLSHQSVPTRGDQSAPAVIPHYPADAQFYLEAIQLIGGQSVRVAVTEFRAEPFTPAECKAVADRLGVPVRRMFACDL